MYFLVFLFEHNKASDVFFSKSSFFQLSSDSDESESEFSLSDSESSSELSDRRSLLFLLFFFSLPFSCLFASLLPDAVVDNAADAEPPAAAPDVDDDELPPDNGLLALFSDVFDNESNGNAPALESDPAPAPPLELVVVVVAAFDAAESLPDVRCCFAVAK